MKLDTDPQNIFFRCVEDSNEAIMISDRLGQLMYVNPAWSKIYGYSRDEAIGQTLRILHSGSHSSEFYEQMWDAILDPAVGNWKGDIFNRAKNGTLVPVLLTITPYRLMNGETAGFMGIALDTTARHEMEAKILHQDRLASIGTLASGLAHEIGTPLGVIRGRAELLMTHVGNARAQSDLEVVISQSDRISCLIQSLLRLSRSSTEVHIVPVAPADVVREVITLLDKPLSDAGIRLTMNFPENFRIAADFSRLEQVLLNLVMNSIHAIQKAHADCGSVNPQHSIHVQGDFANGAARLSVKDSGCGIPVDDLQKVFRPFFTTKDVGDGTGLGLAVVSQIMREMGAEITVSSDFGSGAIFTLLFPPRTPPSRTERGSGLAG